ncbi:MAG: low molecular weight protein-tyrosine-phosphatase [Cyanobacteriota bacterium]|nr:low molecular weight protein-tyrosine-phosphatase [Cyanobacteriota bacterium]
MTPSPRPIRVLFVCLGNICRSPAAEGVFLELLAREGLEQAFRVDSAGTGGWHVGNRADRRMREAAARRGIDLPSRARQLEASDLDTFDHILTMDADNLEAVRRLAAAHAKSSKHVRPLLHHAERAGVSEVPDPYYGGAEGFEHVLDLLEEACRGLLEHLRAAADPGIESQEA